MNSKIFENLISEKAIMDAWKHVKQKSATGGIDGISIEMFESDLGNNILEIVKEISSGKWVPFPYLKAEIPKKTKEKRTLGLLSIKDKIVQQAIKKLIEPRMEKLFVNNSYGYRPGKGALKAIRRALQERTNKNYPWVLRLDIDNYFDNIDHTILQERIKAIISDPEIIRLIMLCVKMGSVNKTGKWKDSSKGIPQGAVLSPLLANLYLHSFDQFILSKKLLYIRYADDFIILCHNKEEAESIGIDASKYLSTKLQLTLNTPQISNIADGFEFLGIQINANSYSINIQKRESILLKIEKFNFNSSGLDHNSKKQWNGIKSYYGELLTENELKTFDDKLLYRISYIIENNWKEFPNRSILQKSLCSLDFLCTEYCMTRKEIRNTLTNIYLEAKKSHLQDEGDIQNKALIAKRKRQYKKLEIENSELVVTTPGCIIGLNSQGITVKKQRLTLFKAPSKQIKHITIMSEGILLSSHLINYASQQKIPIDIFSRRGEHIGFFLSPNSMQCSLWNKQATSNIETRNKLAGKIIEGKITNQLNLVKYFNKYHKSRGVEYIELEKSLYDEVNKFKIFIRNVDFNDIDFCKILMGYESQTAIKYWAYIRLLLSDDGVIFDKRIGLGATDLVNCMLNYGYTILYSRMSQALLAAQLNPYDSVIHVRQSGKPTLSYDFIELFRAQAVDRIVISILQKGEEAEISDGKLTENTKKVLVKKITERMYKYEKYRGESIMFENIIKKQAKEIANYFSEKIAYKPYKAKW